jgi:radical SAM superfamily enzyme YgiQ (UPF0313 family)
MKKNLILVYPPKIKPGYVGDISLALLYLAGAARDAGVCDYIEVFDFNAPVGAGKTLNDLVAKVQQINKEGERTIVGINCFHSAIFPSVREIARTLKAKFNEVKIVTGGVHPTLFAEEIINYCPEFDAVSIGESDNDFPKLLSFLYGESATSDLEGVCLREDGKPVCKPKLSYIQDLDALPTPGYEFFDYSEYAVDTSEWWDPDGIKISPFCLPLLTSRSCPNKCSFCTNQRVMGERFRARSAESGFGEIKHLYDTYGVNYFKVEDDNLTLDRRRILDICNMVIESGIKVYFDARNGISIKTLDEEVVGLMRRAGFMMISLAVESGSDYIRNEVMGKKVEREQIVKAFKLCRAAGMNTNAYFIIGMPEETEETLQETIDLLLEIETDRIAVFAARPLPGTKLHEQCVRDNLLISKYDENPLWTGETEKNTHSMIEFHNERIKNFSKRLFLIKPYKLSMERLVEIDLEIQRITYAKTSSWIDRIHRHHP